MKCTCMYGTRSFALNLSGKGDLTDFFEFSQDISDFKMPSTSIPLKQLQISQ